MHRAIAVTPVVHVPVPVAQSGLEKSTRPLVFMSESLIRASGNLPRLARQLMGLCSGVFAKAKEEEGSQKKGVKRKVEEEDKS